VIGRRFFSSFDFFLSEFFSSFCPLDRCEKEAVSQNKTPNPYVFGAPARKFLSHLSAFFIINICSGLRPYQNLILYFTKNWLKIFWQRSGSGEVLENNLYTKKLW
jgi:hypothetical protein